MGEIGNVATGGAAATGGGAGTEIPGTEPGTTTPGGTSSGGSVAEGPQGPAIAEPEQEGGFHADEYEAICQNCARVFRAILDSSGLPARCPNCGSEDTVPTQH